MAARYRTLGLSVPITEVLDPEKWKERYAWGIPLGESASLLDRVKTVAGSQAADAFAREVSDFPPETIRWHLRAAVSELETKLLVPFGLEVVKSDPVDDGVVLGRDYDRRGQRLPYTFAENEAWFRIDLPSGVISVERVRAYYYGTPVWTISGTEIRVEWGRQGIIHILPINLGQWIVTSSADGGNYGIWQTLALHKSPVPDFWSVDYTRGPISQHGGAPGQIEAVLADWCYCTAGQKLMALIGTARTKGLSGSSVSIDGVSRSVNFAGGQWGIYSAAAQALKEATERIDWKAMRLYKKGLRIKMFGY